MLMLNLGERWTHPDPLLRASYQSAAGALSA